MVVKRVLEGSRDSERTSKKSTLITDFFHPKSTSVKKSTISTTTVPVNESEEVKITAASNKTLGIQSEIETDIQSDKKSDVAETSDYEEFCAQYGFKKSEWIKGLTEEQRELLELEINNLHITWLAFLHKELTKPYFIQLKKFLTLESKKTIFPKPEDIYSWSHFTPLPDIKCLILGQDPYHNFNQAHGLAFSVLEPTRPPPSLINIFKTIRIDYPEFIIPEYKVLEKSGNPGGGNLTKWAQRGILMLNSVLTVECHKANSHAKRGWEQFTEQVIKVALEFHKKQNKGFVIMAWGTPAQVRISKVDPKLANSTDFLVLNTVHPSPLSARRGFFESKVFKKCNEWLDNKGYKRIDWGLFEGNIVM